MNIICDVKVLIAASLIQTQEVDSTLNCCHPNDLASQPIILIFDPNHPIIGRAEQMVEIILSIRRLEVPAIEFEHRGIAFEEREEMDVRWQPRDR